MIPEDWTLEQLATEHPSYATNPIIVHAIFYVKYIEELGSGTVDMFDICKETGLRPPVFDIDARHFTVTVYRPVFDEKGNRVSSEIGQNDTEVKVKPKEVKVKPEEVKVKPNFEIIMKGYRRDLRETCARIWESLAANAELTQRGIATQLQISRFARSVPVSPLFSADVMRLPLYMAPFVG